MVTRTVRVSVIWFLLATGLVMAQNDVPSLSFSVTPGVLRVGQRVKASVRMRNPKVNETVILQATATWTDASGQQRTTTSNSVSLTIDYSIDLRVDFSVGSLRLVSGSAKFDGVPIQPVGSSGIVFDIALPGDGAEHTLELELVR